MVAQSPHKVWLDKALRALPVHQALCIREVRMVNRILTTIYVDDLVRSKEFYINLLGLIPTFETDWIVQLCDPENENVNLTLQPKNHELIPEGFGKQPQGFSIAFVVDSCDEIHVKAQSLELKIVQSPKNEEYGQRRFLTVDPDGTLVDVSSACEPSPEFVAKYFGGSNA